MKMPAGTRELPARELSCNTPMDLTDRQRRILKAVVLEYQSSGRPVGSRTIVERGVVSASPSTVRYELGRLEELGLLESPHTSAGRVPTDLGYRLYVDQLVEEDELPKRSVVQHTTSVDVSSRVDEALRETTQALAEATNLLSVVTSPPTHGAVIRHVEVLQLQPGRIVVVCITETGEVTRHVVSTETPIDPGLVDWAGEYLNEQVAGMSLGQNLLRQRLANPELSPVERAMLALLAPAFTGLMETGPEVHVGGSRVLLERLGSDVQQVVNLVAMLDERRRLLDSLRRVLGSGGSSRRVSVGIGCENDLPELRRLSVVGASYGLTSRPLGMVGVIGPRAMDYPLAMTAVAAAAQSLNALSEQVYHSQ